MGQKTHPIGFRIGVNKTQSSTWFANYGAFSDVLKEDYQIRQHIRQYFEKEFPVIYHRITKSLINVGFVKVKIKRKGNQLELLVYLARAKSIALRKVSMVKLVRMEILRLKRILKEPTKQIRFKILQINKSKTESSLVARSLADKLEKRVVVRKAIRQTTWMLQNCGVKGFKIQVSGRLNGAEIARAEWVREGRVPLQTLRADISYATQKAFTIYGVLGLKVWIFNKEIL